MDNPFRSHDEPYFLAQVAAVKAEKINFTVSQAPGDQAYWSVVAAIRSLNGDKVPQEIRTPVIIVTKENVGKYAEE